MLIIIVLSLLISQINQKFAIALLGKLGHRVFLAENGLLGVQAYERTWLQTSMPSNDRFDIILMDISMPVL